MPPWFKRWLYRGGRPNILARAINAGWAMVHALGILPNRLVTLQVKGSRSGRLIRFPLAMTVVGGQRYLVSMLGNDAAWVRNVRLAHGRAVLLHGIVEEVRLELVDAAQRPPVLKAYLQIAPGARPHIPVDKDAPQEAFATIAEGFPVFRVLSAQTESGKPYDGVDGGA